jgi:hypothetical protein
MRRLQLIAILLACVFLASTWLVSLTSSAGVYNPWYDLDDNGKIDIFDVVRMAGSYGTSGEPSEAKAALEFDSGWINITDQRGQSLNVTHGLNSTDIMVDVTGKAAVDAEPHHNFYGLTTHMVADPGWNCTLGGGRPFSMVQTSDGGYVIVGDAVPPYPAMGYWCVLIMKTDALGNHLWNQTYGGFEMWADDRGRSVVQTTDGGYAIIGSHTGFVDMGDWSHDAWLIKTDAAGNHLWNQTYGDQWFEDWGTSVVQTVDGGYTIGGYSRGDVWLVKTDPAGNHLWNQTCGGGGNGIAHSMMQTLEGGYFIVSESSNGFYLVKTFGPGEAPMIEVWLAWTLYRGADDPYWNYVRVRIWAIKDTP